MKSKYNGSSPRTTTISVSQDGVILSKVVTLKPATTKSLIVEDTPIFKNVRIYNIYGVKVYEEKNTVNFNIENTNLNRGIYFFESTDNEGNIVREKVMKNK
ncbi:MAG: T9SS type A sorting domain-containing protein [Dysgonomonas mossii]|nr:T9SS type A sorting domain-containing protein [Dysgonomonas mossii]